jgi:hypothetical protein
MSGCGTPTNPTSGSGAGSSVAGPNQSCALKCKITSKTDASVPKDRARTTVGVGEKVKLTFSPGSASWTASGGKLSSKSGSSVTFTAPDRAASVTINASGGGCKCSITFKVIEPTGMQMERVPGSHVWHTKGIPSVGFHANIYIVPATVSFENIEISEDDCTGAVTGYFVGTTLDGLHHAGHGAGTWVTVGTVKAGKGSRVDGQDTIQSGYCNFGTPYKNGTFDWPIPWKFRVGGGGAKKFFTAHQRFTINASGDMMASKGGASANAKLNDATSGY